MLLFTLTPPMFVLKPPAYASVETPTCGCGEEQALSASPFSVIPTHPSPLLSQSTLILLAPGVPCALAVHYSSLAGRTGRSRPSSLGSRVGMRYIQDGIRHSQVGMKHSPVVARDTHRSA